MVPLLNEDWRTVDGARKDPSHANLDRAKDMNAEALGGIVDEMRSGMQATKIPVGVKQNGHARRKECISV